MYALNVLQLVEQVGFEIRAEGDHLHIKQGHHLPNSLKANIRECREQILTILRKDFEVKGSGLMISVPGKLYMVTINKGSIVFVE